MNPVSLRRWGWVLGALLLCLGASVGLLAWRAHRSLSERPDDVLASLSEAIGLPVEADGVRVRWWPPGLVVYGLRIPDQSPLGPGDLVHADEARLSVGTWPLLSGNVVVEQVEIVSPVVRLVRGVDGSWNWSSGTVREDRTAATAAEPDAPGAGKTASAAAQPESRESARFDVADLVISRGRVSFRDRAIPGVPELEISGADGLLVRGTDGSTLEFQGDVLGGPPGNVHGALTARDGSEEAELSVSASAIPANRLAEVLQLARGTIPFGALIDGVIAADVTGRMPWQWPPGRAAIEVGLDADEATVSIAQGQVRKAAGTPLRLELGLYAGDELLHLRHATLLTGEARVEVSDPNEADASESRHAPLRVSSSDLTAATVAQWVPILAAIAPEGDLALQGTIAPGRSETAIQLRLSGTDLGLRVGGEAASLAAAAVDFDVRPAGRYTAGVSLEALRSGDLFADRLTAAVDGGGGTPISVRVDGARGGRGETEVERLALECEISDDRALVRRLDVDGLGGNLQAQGQLERDGADGLALRLAPQWDGLDFAGLLRLFGVTVDVQGLLTGQAVLAARQGAEETFLDTLRGVFDVRLERGEVPELNLARATVDNLGAIPGLRQAIERRAEEKVPELLARTSRIDSLRIDGSVEEREVSIAHLRLDAPDYAVSAGGRVSFDGGVDLEGELVLGEAATSALESASGILAVLAPAGKAIRIPVSIDGRYPDLVSAPSPAFVTDSLKGRVSGEEAKGAGALLRRLLGVGGDRGGDGEPSGESEP